MASLYAKLGDFSSDWARAFLMSFDTRCYENCHMGRSPQSFRPLQGQARRPASIHFILLALRSIDTEDKWEGVLLADVVGFQESKGVACIRVQS